MSDTEEYLQPGFDPATLTVPRLRSILVTYNVHYASNSKKSDLVELFNINIAPQASKILARRARAKRSSMGIVDAGEPAQSHSTASGFDDLPPQPKPKRSTSRQPRETVMRSAEVYAEDDEDSSHRRVRRASPRKRQTRSTSYQPQPLPAQPSASDTDTGPDVDAARKRPVSSRRTRAQTPKVKLEPPEEEETSLLPSRVPTASPSRSPRRRTTSHQQQQQQQLQQQQTSTDEETTFTDDNPFQSGSSPLAAASNAADVRRRRTAGTEPASAIKKRPSAVAAPSPDPFYSRRLTTDIVLPPSASSSFTLVNPTTPAPETDEEEEEEEEEAETSVLEPGEEFTPEAQLELAQEEEAQRQRNASGGRASKKNKAPSTRRRGILSALVTPLLVLLLTLLGAYGAWYRQEKIAVGYCGLGRLAVPLLAHQFESLEGYVGGLVERLPEPARDFVQSMDLHTPASLQVLIEPQCEPCPLHAFCYADLVARCESGYLLKPSPWSLGGVVPLPPTCEPDGERARRVKAVADKAIEELRDRRARWECGDLVDEDGTPATGPAMDVPQLKEIIGDKRSKKMSKDEFDDLWTVAIGEIESREEVEVEPVYETTDSGTVSNSRLSSTSLSRLPFTCAIRRSIRLSVARYRFALSVLVLSVLAAFYVRASFRARRAMRARVPALVDVALERLIAQKVLFLEDDEEYGDEEVGGSGNGGSKKTGAGAVEDDDEDPLRPDPFLFLPQLRDDVLRSTHSLAARERIWKHVRAVVEQNSNVRAGQRQGRNGEVGRAWEWVGPVGMARAAGDEDGNGRSSLFLDRSARRRRSGRVSMGVPAAEGVGRPRQGVVAATVAAAEARQAGPAGPEPGRENQSALHRRWQESRPVF